MFSSSGTRPCSFTSFSTSMRVFLIVASVFASLRTSFAIFITVWLSRVNSRTVTFWLMPSTSMVLVVFSTLSMLSMAILRYLLRRSSNSASVGRTSIMSVVIADESEFDASSSGVIFKYLSLRESRATKNSCLSMSARMEKSTILLPEISSASSPFATLSFAPVLSLNSILLRKVRSMSSPTSAFNVSRISLSILSLAVASAAPSSTLSVVLVNLP